MTIPFSETLSIHQLEKGREIPYSLLLLADPEKDAINRYIFDSDIYIATLENKLIATY